MIFQYAILFPILPLSLSSAKEINFFLLSILTKVDKHLSEWDNEICEQHLGQGLAVFSESLQIMRSLEWWLKQRPVEIYNFCEALQPDSRWLLHPGHEVGNHTMYDVASWRLSKVCFYHQVLNNLSQSTVTISFCMVKFLTTICVWLLISAVDLSF